MNKIALFITIICGSFLLKAQSAYEPTAGTMAADYFMEAQSALLKQEYPRSVRFFKRALQAQPTLTAAKRLIGQCHELMGDYPAAADYYLRVIKDDSLFSRILYFQLGETYYKMGQPELALSYFKQYEEYLEQPADRFGLQGLEERADELLCADRLPNNKRACEVSIDSVKFINITEIHHLGKGVNSRFDDYFPFVTNNQRGIYFTRQNEEGDEDLYFSTFKTDTWKSADRIKDFNTPYPEGMSTLVRNGRKLFFTACLRDSVGGPCDIWEAVADNDEVSSVKMLGDPINSVYWESQAAVSCDGSRLFFSSNRPGGIGGTDLYMTEIQENGKWGLPVNLGDQVNTIGDEEAPFISNDGKTLYFSSTGHLGLGEQDIFMCWWDDRLDRWSVPINLGPPVNGPHRELGFFLSADGKNGYFASNRVGGEGGMDIYQFKLSEKLYGEPITFVEGQVLDSVLLIPVPGMVEINGRAPVMTDDQGVFFLCVGADETLDFTFEKETYHVYQNQFFIPEWENKTFFDLQLLIRPTLSFLGGEENEARVLPTRKDPKEHLVNHTIYFGFDSAELQNAEIERLEALLESLADRDVIKLEIVGFADDIGGADYNIQLSEDRAKIVAVFLLQNDMEINDIHIEGKGSIATDREPRSRSRRVDLRITLIH